MAWVLGSILLALAYGVAVGVPLVLPWEKGRVFLGLFWGNLLVLGGLSLCGLGVWLAYRRQEALMGLQTPEGEGLQTKGIPDFLGFMNKVLELLAKEPLLGFVVLGILLVSLGLWTLGLIG